MDVRYWELPTLPSLCLSRNRLRFFNGSAGQLRASLWRSLEVKERLESSLDRFEQIVANKFESVLTRGANENSVLTLEVPEKRESESSGPIFRTDGRNLEGCVRETEISLQTECAAVGVVEPRKT
ncbi:MAG: hypothetical protein DWH99_09000 [Planctomycetota bacterium]|nr:MAG: hypothetical protein DWH99_09000 [Planctomycetota bacterium]